jgi:hypothetical protein
VLCLDCYIRDLQQRKSNYPPNYRYGINLQIDRKLSHIFLLIVLAGDVAINPGPLSCSSPPHISHLHLTFFLFFLIIFNFRKLSDFQKGPELNKLFDKEDMHILHNYEKY